MRIRKDGCTRTTRDNVLAFNVSLNGYQHSYEAETCGEIHAITSTVFISDCLFGLPMQTFRQKLTHRYTPSCTRDINHIPQRRSAVVNCLWQKGSQLQ